MADKQTFLDALLAIFEQYTIATALASALPVGSIIALSRVNSQLRAVLHDLPRSGYTAPGQEISQIRPGLAIGQHGTFHWRRLKQLSQQECSLPDHIKKHEDVHMCRSCGVPVCKACIVRRFFKHMKENTYRKRIRLMCTDCTHRGNVRTDFRHPLCPEPEMNTDTDFDTYFCQCQAGRDGWICNVCTDAQNESVYDNTPPRIVPLTRTTLNEPTMFKEEQSKAANLPCYGLNCRNIIAAMDRVKCQKICLWCSKPLPRQYSGEERHQWESRQIEIRNELATKRAKDMKAYRAKRFQDSTMSRREMRGTVECVRLHGYDDHRLDKRDFLKNLDIVNYAKFQAQPDGHCIWQSKQGIWRYNKDLLERIGEQYLHKKHIVTRKRSWYTSPNQTTEIKGLTGARTNRQCWNDQKSLFKYGWRPELKRLVENLTRIRDAGYTLSMDDIRKLCRMKGIERADIEMVADAVLKDVDQLEGQDQEHQIVQCESHKQHPFLCLSSEFAMDIDAAPDLNLPLLFDNKETDVVESVSEPGSRYVEA